MWWGFDLTWPHFLLHTTEFKPFLNTFVVQTFLWKSENQFLQGSISLWSGPDTQSFLKIAWRMCRYLWYFTEWGTLDSHSPSLKVIHINNKLQACVPWDVVSVGHSDAPIFLKAQSIGCSWRYCQGLLLDEAPEQRLDYEPQVRIFDLWVLFLAPH